MGEWSQAVEDYVKTIWLLDEAGEPATGQAVARRLGVSQASVTSMIKRLGEAGLLEYEPYRPVTLTPKGRLIALEVVRHHRLIELFLSEALGMPWDRIHAEAEVLEHHISEELEELIAQRLGHPQFDPHGHPIPTREGELPGGAMRRLDSLQAGHSATVRQVRSDDAEVLRYLGGLGLTPGAGVRLQGRAPLGGTLTVAVGEAGTEHALAAELAALIDVCDAT